MDSCINFYFVQNSILLLQSLFILFEKTGKALIPIYVLIILYHFMYLRQKMNEIGEMNDDRLTQTIEIH